eukprot:2668021-Amphidinium_carterae.1
MSETITRKPAKSEPVKSRPTGSDTRTTRSGQRPCAGHAAHALACNTGQLGIHKFSTPMREKIPMFMSETNVT